MTTRREHDGASAFGVSVLGLGAMGAGMAKTLVARGKRVAIWNRSPGKAESLEMAGAHLCGSAEEALLASPVSIMVLLDNAAVQDVLWSIDQARALADRTVINFTTNSVTESRELQLLVERAGGSYVKGSIVAYPRNIGHPKSYGIYSGHPETIAQNRSLLAMLTPNVLSLAPEEAAALSVMLHNHAFASMMSFYEAVAASPGFDLPIAEMGRLVNDASRFFISDAIQDAAHRLETNAFDGDQARLSVHVSAFEHLAEAMRARGAIIPVFTAVCNSAKEAQDMGFGDYDISSMV